MLADDKQQATAGARLAEARQGMGISQVEAADVLNLTQRTIAAIEADDYDNLPGWVYVSGYIRAYARMLGLDPDVLVASAAAKQKEVQGDPSQGFELATATKHTVNKMPVQLTFRQWVFVALVILAVVVIASVFDEIPRPQGEVVAAQQQAVVGTPPLVASQPQPSPQPSSDGLSIEQPEADMVAVESATEALDTNIENTTDALTAAAQDVNVAITDVSQAESAAAVLVDNASAPTGETAQTIAAQQTEQKAQAAQTEQKAETEQAERVEQIAAVNLDTATKIAAVAVELSSDEQLQQGDAASATANEYQVPYYGEDETGARKLTAVGVQRLRFEFSADCWMEIRDSADALLYADLGRAGEVRRFVGDGPFSLKLGFAEGVQVYFNAEAIDLAPYTRNQIARMELGQ